ncbi:5-oxoprolinase subunit A OS=Rhodanobacter lindaniclasticus OX=75310 GN=pxpA PE=3 SV=1 [Rhodanobacter lindaniclasticus]
MTRIDLNGDLGESFGAWPMGEDAALLDVGSVGQTRLRLPRRRFHDHAATVAAAMERGVAIGAHVPPPRPAGFSAAARCLATPAEVHAMTLYQSARCTALPAPPAPA